VVGELNLAASKKYDLEGWFPSEGRYRELVSCSNCTDYQSRSLDIRLSSARVKGVPNQEKKFVHMLNSTLCATQRTLCCLVEVHQTVNGIRVPTVLQRYVGTDFIAFA
jgi:seryl-tRNA synthetase